MEPINLTMLSIPGLDPQSILRTNLLVNQVTRIYTNRMLRGSIRLYTGKWVFHIPHSNTLPPTFPRLVEPRKPPELCTAASQSVQFRNNSPNMLLYATQPGFSSLVGESGLQLDFYLLG